MDWAPVMSDLKTEREVVVLETGVGAKAVAEARRVEAMAIFMVEIRMR